MNDGRLSSRQRALVEAHLPLVGDLLGRLLGRVGATLRRNTRDDLYQEACLGLMEAACAFDGRAEAFEAFAVRRIQAAVHRALRRLLGARRGAGAWPAVAGCDRGSVKVLTLHIDPQANASQELHDPFDEPRRTAVGERLREKYDQAVRRAAGKTERRGRRRHDRHALHEALVEQRFLVPDDDYRVSLRQIARETGSSYSRVMNADRRLADATRRLLGEDAEFALLRKQAAGESKRRADRAVGVHRTQFDIGSGRLAENSQCADGGQARAGTPEFEAMLEGATREQAIGWLRDLLSAGVGDPVAAWRGALNGLSEREKARVFAQLKANLDRDAAAIG